MKSKSPTNWPLNSRLATNLKRIVKSRGLSDKKLVKLLDGVYSETMINHQLQGSVVLKPEIAIKICDIIGFTINFETGEITNDKNK